MSLSRSFVEWGLSASGIPDTVHRAARQHVLDGIGNAMAADRLGAVSHVVDEAMEYEFPAVASVIGRRQRIPQAMAALANGALIHGLDYDDTHGGALVHGTAVTLPAVLAMGQARDSDFNTAIEAMITGLEVTMRIGRAVPHGFHRRGFHATSVAGVFGATLAAAKLAGLDEPTTVNALGLAGSTASGSLEFLSSGSSTKQIHPGWASMSAVLAVRLAERGATGPDSILDGRFGLFRSYLGADLEEPASLLSDLGSVWETTQMTLKPYPVCQLSHATLDATKEIMDRLSPERIEVIDVSLPGESIPVVAEPASDKIKPRSTYEAKFSVQWDVAALLIDGHVSIDHFTESQLSRQSINDLASRVRITEYSFDGVPADAPGMVEITTTDGSTYSGHVEASRGSPNNPLTDADLIEKFRMNVGPAVNDPTALAESILTGELNKVDDLLKMTEPT